MIWFLGILCLLVLITWISVGRIERRHPPKGQFFKTSAGLKLHYLLMGEDHADQGTLVLLHGASSNLAEFTSSIAPELAKSRQVLMVDRPGLGYSERGNDGWIDPTGQAELVQELVEHCAIDAPVLVGHSWSGALVMAHLLRFPEVARAAVLIAPATHSWDGPSALHNRISRLPVVGWLLRWTLLIPVGRFAIDAGIRSIFYRDRVPQGYREKAGIDLILRPSSWLANANDMCLLNDYLKQREQDYDQVTQPIFAMVGDSDEIVLNRIHIGGLRRQISDLKVVEFNQTGHSPHQTHPRETVDNILRFISDISDKDSPVTD